MKQTKPQSHSRRQFLKCATGAASLAGTAPWWINTQAIAADPPAAPCSRPVFHSRHIPVELLNLETPTGKDVVRNGLCDTLKPDVLKRLQSLGVELIEMRFAWWEIEPESNRFAWDRVLRDIDAVLDAGLKVGVFAWFQYPPTWYDPEQKSHARLQALGGNLQSTVLSLWDPKTLDAYDRLLGVSAEKLKGRVSFVYNAVSGNYGEVTYELGAQHYKFSSPGSVNDYFLGDRCARASFAQTLEKKYGTVDSLNKAWEAKKASFDDDLMPQLPFAKNSLMQRDDCMQWATESVIEFADRVCVLYKKHFPGLPGGLPIGFVNETMRIGQIKSRAAKLAAKHGLTSRWTGCAFLGEFGRSHLLARRIASAAHFYGSPFGTEAALIINAENAANALYESLSNGASMIHDDPQNILRAVEVQEAMRPTMIVDPPAASACVFYPVEDEMLELEGFSWKDFVRLCAELRRQTDYDVCDALMIADGCLAKKKDLFFLTDAHLREETARAILDFASSGGRVWFYQEAKAAVLHQPTSFFELAEKKGLTLGRLDDVGKTGLYRFEQWGEPIPHITQTAFTIPDDGQPCYRTMHTQHESCYFPKQHRFEIRKRA